MNTAEELPPPYAPPEVLPFELISLASTVGSDLVPLPALKPFLVAFASLVSEIAAFDGVEQQLATQSDLVSQMEANLAQDKKQLDLLHKSIEKELKDIHKLEHFSFKQLGAKIKGKTHYESQLNGATAKLLEDRQKADKLASEIASLTEVLTSAVTERDFLASRQSELQNWRQQLDSFLDKTFYSIHDPSVLVLDREARLKQHIFNLEAANAESAVLRSEFLAAQKEIESAKQLLNSSVNNLDSALQSANTDIYFSNGYSEWNEYASSQQAQQDAARAGKHVQRAKAILPGLPPSLGLFEFEGVSAYGSIFFDNIFSDIQNIQYLQNLLPKIVATRQNVIRIALWIRDSIEAFNQAIAANSENMMQARRDLFDFRVSLLHAGMTGEGGKEAGLKKEGVKESGLNYDLQLLRGF